jgi:peptidoglycan/xylan/chitin deacetylase (PgdA/CDA1 family)
MRRGQLRAITVFAGQIKTSKVLWTAGAVTAAGVMAYAVRGRTSTLLADSVCHGPSDRRSLALTFDDGPTPGTLRVLEVLDRHRVKATFFQCGMHVRRNPQISREILAAGHELGNHTDTHPLLAMHTPDFILNEMVRAQLAIEEATGVTPKYFRPPYGVRWFGLGEAQRRMNLLGVMWSVIGRDWRLPGAAVARRVLRAASNGAIICLHDGRAADTNPDITSTLEAVRIVIPILIDQGYRFETVSQLLCPTN